MRSAIILGCKQGCKVMYVYVASIMHSIIEIDRATEFGIEDEF